MLRLFLTPLCVIWLAFSASAQNLQSDWITQIGGYGIDGIPFHKPDGKGNVFISGSLNLYYDYTRQSDGFIDSIKVVQYNYLNSTVYFAKLNEFGKVIFYRTITWSGNAETRDMEIDSKGNVYILLTFQGSVNLEGTIVSSNPYGTGLYSPSTLLIKYSQDGAVLWYKNFTSELEVIPLKLEVNSHDQIITLTDHPFNYNYPTSSVDINGTTHEFNDTNTLLTCFSSTGDILWFKDLFYRNFNGFIPTGYRYTTDFKVDKSDNIFVYGQFENGIYFSETDSVYVQYPAVSNFLLKFSSSDRSLEWVRQIDHPEARGVLTAIEIFLRGDRIGLVCQNRSSNTVVFNGKTLTDYNLGIEFNSAGLMVDVYDFYTESSVILDVTTDADGNVYFVGGLASDVHFEYPGYDFYSTDGQDFITKYNGDQLVWADFMGHGGGYRIELDSHGDIFLIGAFACTADVFGRTFTAPNCFTQQSDILVSRINANSLFVTGPAATCPSDDVEFQFDFLNMVYEAPIQEVTWQYEDSVSHSNKFHYQFNEGGIKNIQVTLQTEDGRIYKRTVEVNVQDVYNPILSFSSGALFCTGIAKTFNWYKDGELFASSTMGMQKPEFDTGVYKAEIITAFGCTFVSNDLLVVFTAVEDLLNSNDVKVFPNPFINELEISSNSVDRSIEAKLYDNTGRIINASVFKEKLVLDLATLSRGVYYLQLNDGAATSIRKVVKM